jgi:glycosyltransferase involved in cell wall biosynthesis
MFDQAKSFIYYAFAAQRIVKNQKYDLIFATSSRLMTAALGAWISKWMNIPLYLDIRDIFLDTIFDVLPKKTVFFLSPILSMIERLTIGRACHVNLVSPGFREYFTNRYPKKSFSYHMNGIDEEFLNISPCLERVKEQKEGQRSPLKILYAGNIGEGQGLHKIIPMLAKKLSNRVSIRIIGAGGRLPELNEALRLMGIENVEVAPPMARSELINEYYNADILFLHLNHHSAFEKVLPSKIFEYAALGKPILAGVSGYAAEFLGQEVINSAIFSPCDVNGAIAALGKLEIKELEREEFIAKYLRKNIMKILADEIICIANSKK